VTITDRMAAWRRERRVLQRVSRAAWRLEQAERERAWALAPARADGVSVRTLAAAAGLVSARVHQITAGADVLAGLLAGPYRGDRSRSRPGLEQPPWSAAGCRRRVRGRITWPQGQSQQPSSVPSSTRSAMRGGPVWVLVPEPIGPLAAPDW